ncbi:MAG: glycosyltransferase [Aulosira sp. DedQUE10]|nr:glycosyltransferase [Aulosira sp. DedQUE10]
MPSISIIIPCYNAEPFLHETVNSIFKQTFSDYEIILIDDGSKDKTAGVIKSFENKVKAEFQSNKGASFTRNRGTALAKGEFIQYLDADDLLRPEALQTRVDALYSNNADVAYSDWQKLEEQSDGSYVLGDIISRRIEDVHLDTEIALFTNFWCPPAALMYRRSIVDKIGTWNESLPIIQDARFLLDAALIGGNFVYVPGIGADYRVHQKNSLSRKSNINFVIDCFHNALQIEEVWKNHGGISKERSLALQKVYAQIARFFFEHDSLKFEQVMNRIYKLNPSYIPDNPKVLNILSRRLGYKNAEAVALMYRKLKKLFKKSLFKKK